jgi:hypothetical protein
MSKPTLYFYDSYLLTNSTLLKNQTKNLKAWSGLDYSQYPFMSCLDFFYGIKVTPSLSTFRWRFKILPQECLAIMVWTIKPFLLTIDNNQLQILPLEIST